MIRHGALARTERTTVSPRPPSRGPEPALSLSKGPPGTAFAGATGPRISAPLRPGDMRGGGMSGNVMIRHGALARTERTTVSPRPPSRGPEPALSLSKGPPGTAFAGATGPRISAPLRPG